MIAPPERRADRLQRLSVSSRDEVDGELAGPHDPSGAAGDELVGHGQAEVSEATAAWMSAIEARVLVARGRSRRAPRGELEVDRPPVSEG